MGIKGINKFLKEKCPEVFEIVDMSLYRYKKIAVDAAIYICKYKMVYGDNVMDAYVNFIASLRENKIHPVFVFDGESPVEKNAEKKARGEAKDKQVQRIANIETDLNIYYETGVISDELAKANIRALEDGVDKSMVQKLIDDEVVVPFNEDKIRTYISKLKSRILKITPEDYTAFKGLLDIMSIKYLQAETEAEILCAQLCKQNLVSAVLTADTDVLAAGCPVMLSQMNGKSFVQVRLENVLKQLDLTEKEWLDLCIMCGTDFNKKIYRVGPHSAYKYLKTYGTLENIPSEKLDVSILNYEAVRKIFTHDNYPNTIPFMPLPNMLLLRKWLDENGIRVKFSRLRVQLQGGPIYLKK